MAVKFLNYRIRLVLNLVKDFNFLLFRVNDIFVSQDQNVKIPKIVYQTTNSRWIPRRFHADVMHFRARNPDFTFITFDQSSMTSWMKLHFKNEVILSAYLSSRFGVMQSDIFKYCYGYINGGISIDLSKFISRPLSEIFTLGTNTLILSQQFDEIDTSSIHPSEFTNLGLNNALLVNWCFATAPHHQGLLSIINYIETCFLRSRGVMYENPKVAIWETTGPVAFNRGLLDYFGNHLPTDTLIVGIDFGEMSWPKFKSANLVNVFSKHYTEFQNCIIFERNS